MQGLIFDIKHCAIHDGPGIRTTVFFKGCPLNCWWCHNPESISPNMQLIEVIKRVGNKSFRESTIIGKNKSTAEIVSEIEKDNIFFDESKGGVTFSGGEPFYQTEFLIELSKRCKEKGFHTALDTSGYASVKTLEMVIPFIDLFLYDIKLLDNKLHQKYVGVPNSTILRNLDFILSRNKKVIIRYPLVPGINDSKTQLEALKEFINNRINEIHFLPYHVIGRNKYEQLGFEYKLEEIESPSEMFLNEIIKDFSRSDLVVKIGG